MELTGTRTRGDVILWGALGCALVGTAHAEYTLATATGVHPWVALAVPGALDLYVVRALQQRRDVLLAVLAMVAANVASHLITSGVLAVGWQVIAAVGALPPLILWRVYSLKHIRNRTELLWGLEAGAVPGEVSAPEVPAPAPSAPAPETDADWLPDFLAEQVHPSAPVLPPPPPEYASVPVPTAVPAPDAVWLSALDSVHLPRVREYLAECAVSDTVPSVRGLKAYAGIGQDRASRLLKYVKEEP